MKRPHHQLTLMRNFAIEFTHVPSGKFVIFDGFLEDFSDDYRANWTSDEVYGRSDPIMTYKNTTRKMSISWGVLAADLAESISNLAKIEVLMSMLYPHYTADENATIEASPLIKVRFANMAVDLEYTENEDDTGDNFFLSQEVIKKSAPPEEQKRDIIRPVLNKLYGASGLVAAVDGFTYKPDLKNGVFMGHGTIFPRYVPMKCDFTVLHTKPLGWEDSGLKNEISIQFGTEGGNSQWRGSSRWPYGVGGLSQRIPGVPNMQNKKIVAGIKQAKFAAITGQVDDKWKASDLDGPDAADVFTDDVDYES